MSEEFKLKHLFRPAMTTKRKRVGSGLYSVREAVRARGDRIDVKSEQNAGTTFSVVLPLPDSTSEFVRALSTTYENREPSNA